MLGFRILYAALFTLVRKLPQAIYIAAIPTILIYLIIAFTTAQADLMLNFDLAFYVRMLGFLILPLPLISWASVNWHRMIVLGEKASPFPVLRDGLLFKHSWRLLVLMLGVIGVSVAFFYAIDLIFTETGFTRGNELIFGLVIVGGFFVYFTGTAYTVQRFSSSLVGIGSGDGTTLRQSWGMTQPYTAALLVIAVTYFVCICGSLVVLSFVSSANLWLLWVVLWLFIASIISVMTEFYAYIRAQSDVTEVFG